MAKGILEFDLNEPDDVMAHKRAVKATDMACALFEIEMNTKKRIEHELEAKDFKGEGVSNYEVLEIAFQRIYEVIREHNIEIEELIN